MRKYSVLIILIIGLLSVQNISAQLAEGSFQNKRNAASTFKRNCFGADIGIGDLDYEVGAYWGVKYIYNLNSYLGIDVVGLNFLAKTSDAESSIVGQAMTGFRCNTGSLGRNISIYSIFRGGYGLCNEDQYSPCCEFEVGLKFSPKLYIGYTYNYQEVNSHTYDYYQNSLNSSFIKIGIVL